MNRLARVLFAAAAASCTPAIVAAATCSVDAPALAFGSYDVFAASPLQSTTTVRVTCSKSPSDPSSLTVSFTVALSTGASATYAQRTLASGANTLGYNLYTNSSRTLVWGDGTGGSQLASGSVSLTNGNPQRTTSLTVYGRVPAQQNAGVGSYGDSVLVTVNY